jgi:hypothetical protein
VRAGDLDDLGLPRVHAADFTPARRR